jgi:hypothetical protein
VTDPSYPNHPLDTEELPDITDDEVIDRPEPPPAPSAEPEPEGEP